MGLGGPGGSGGPGGPGPGSLYWTRAVGMDIGARDPARGRLRRRRRDPGDQLTHPRPIGPQAEHDTLPLPIAPNQPLPLEVLKVAGGAGLGKADLGRQLGHAPLPVEQGEDDAKAGRVAETCEDVAGGGLMLIHCMAVHIMPDD